MLTMHEMHSSPAKCRLKLHEPSLHSHVVGTPNWELDHAKGDGRKRNPHLCGNANWHKHLGKLVRFSNTQQSADPQGSYTPGVCHMETHTYIYCKIHRRMPTSQFTHNISKLKAQTSILSRNRHIHLVSCGRHLCSHRNRQNRALHTRKHESCDIPSVERSHA